MRALSGTEILGVWDLGESQSPAQRALTLLGCACPEYSAAELYALRIGQRDALLFSLRERMFGSALRSYAECPQCLGRLEFSLSTAELCLPAPPDEAAELQCGDYQLRFRFPDSRDLLAATACREFEAGVALLLQRCIVHASYHGVEVAAAALPEPVLAQLRRELGRRDPQADIQLQLRCASCGHDWALIFDIGTYLWKEIAAQAGRILVEIDSLARTYGWNEAEILGLSPRRRQRYLELTGA